MAKVRELVVRSGLPAPEARRLLERATGTAREALIAHDERTVDEPAAGTAEALFARRRAGEPMAYLLGAREFYGLDLVITPDVLIPRPETELIVDLALERIRQGARRIVDLGTGSGAIAVAIAREAPGAEVWAVDASEAALVVARANALRHAPGVRLVRSDWFAGLAGEGFDLVVSNPPYVAEDDPHLGEGDVRFEPRAALAGGPDGLDCIRRIVVGARAHLVPHGWLLFEHGCDQGGACRALMRDSGYREVTTWRDLAGLERVSGGTAA